MKHSYKAPENGALSCMGTSLLAVSTIRIVEHGNLLSYQPFHPLLQPDR